MGGRERPLAQKRHCLRVLGIRIPRSRHNGLNLEIKSGNPGCSQTAVEWARRYVPEIGADAITEPIDDETPRSSPQPGRKDGVSRGNVSYLRSDLLISLDVAICNSSSVICKLQTQLKPHKVVSQRQTPAPSAETIICGAPRRKHHT